MKALKESTNKLEDYQCDHDLIKFNLGPRPVRPAGLDSRHFAKLCRIDYLLNETQSDPWIIHQQSSIPPKY
jgi:hypothetical protein